MSHCIVAQVGDKPIECFGCLDGPACRYVLPLQSSLFFFLHAYQEGYISTCIICLGCLLWCARLGFNLNEELRSRNR